jgi:hypothetical protein
LLRLFRGFADGGNAAGGVHGCFLLGGLGWCGLCRARMVFCAVPIEGGGDVGCGDVFQPIAEEFHGNIPENLPTGGAREGDRIAAKAQFCEVYGVLAEEVVAHSHVGETPPCKGVWCG